MSHCRLCGSPQFISISYVGVEHPGQQQYTVELPVSEQFDAAMDQRISKRSMMWLVIGNDQRQGRGDGQGHGKGAHGGRGQARSESVEGCGEEVGV